MVNISRYFLASAYTICSQCTNRDETNEAMKQTIKTSLEYKRAIYVKNLYKQLKKDGIGTTAIEANRKHGKELARTYQVEIYVLIYVLIELACSLSKVLEKTES